MTSAAPVSPYTLQCVVDNVFDTIGEQPEAGPPRVQCAQALGSDIYVGCSNGELLRFALRSNNQDLPDAYALLSRQFIQNSLPIEDMVLLPSISRALVFSERQVFFYTLPALDMVPSNIIKPIRNALALVLDEQQTRRRAPERNQLTHQAEPVEFCIIKRNAIAMYSLRERLYFQKDVPLPPGTTCAKRSGKYLCIADDREYSMVNLEAASLFPLLPLNQSEDTTQIKPSITVISENEFLILSWVGSNTLGLFITGEGDPVRGTFGWPIYPVSVALDYPNVTILLPDSTVEVYNVESQTLTQSFPAPSPVSTDRRRVAYSATGFSVPSTQRQAKLHPTPVSLLRRKQRSEPEVETTKGDAVSLATGEEDSLDQDKLELA